MQILQTVIVKQVLTEKLKQKLLASYSEKINQLQTECEQLRFERKKTDKQYKGNQKDIAEFYEKETQQRLDKIKNIEFQKKQLELLPLGSELKECERQTLTDVKVGDCWSGPEQERAIVVKDGIIIEIR
ncbi:YlqD family protein [Bacillus xiapuensis]|uniref:YlqD family protein n=1 Tax=Bacillus xiapuensis TaxID=2014075 RepID=UPI000C23D349|nr:YlqD family protein [Bacillus xiapuensis]